MKIILNRKRADVYSILPEVGRIHCNILGILFTFFFSSWSIHTANHL